MSTILEILTTVMGIVMSLAYFPQAYKIFKNKSSESISIISYCIFALGTSTWLVYGILTKSWIIILSFIPGVIGSWLVLILTVRYINKH
ncbi:MAG: SemiSWEET family transporter [Candidatus Woesearchaeota archaeon]